MELRFLQGDFGNIKYKLQFREFDMHNQITEWKDVPCVKEGGPWICSKCGSTWDCWEYCAKCGAVKP